MNAVHFKRQLVLVLTNHDFNIDQNNGDYDVSINQAALTAPLLIMLQRASHKLCKRN